MCYMWNGELRHGRPPNPDLEEYYLKLFMNWLLSEKDERGFIKHKTSRIKRHDTNKL